MKNYCNKKFILFIYKKVLRNLYYGDINTLKYKGNFNQNKNTNALKAKQPPLIVVKVGEHVINDNV